MKQEEGWTGGGNSEREVPEMGCAGPVPAALGGPARRNSNGAGGGAGPVNPVQGEVGSRRTLASFIGGDAKY